MSQENSTHTILRPKLPRATELISVQGYGDWELLVQDSVCLHVYQCP